MIFPMSWIIRRPSRLDCEREAVVLQERQTLAMEAIAKALEDEVRILNGRSST